MSWGRTSQPPCTRQSCSLALSAFISFVVLPVLDRLFCFSLLTAVLSFVSCFTPVPRRVPVTLHKHWLTEHTVQGARARKPAQARMSREPRNSPRRERSP